MAVTKARIDIEPSFVAHVIPTGQVYVCPLLSATHGVMPGRRDLSSVHCVPQYNTTTELSAMRIRRGRKWLRTSASSGWRAASHARFTSSWSVRPSSMPITLDSGLILEMNASRRVHEHLDPGGPQRLLNGLRPPQWSWLPSVARAGRGSRRSKAFAGSRGAEAHS